MPENVAKRGDAGRVAIAKRIARHDGRMVGTIQKLRGRGLGYGRIADKLNDLADRLSCSGWKSWHAKRHRAGAEYPGSTDWASPRGKLWSKMAVKRICKRHGL